MKWQIRRRRREGKFSPDKNSKYGNLAKLTVKKKGECYVYVVAQNGVVKRIFVYCNRDGLFYIDVKKAMRV